MLGRFTIGVAALAWLFNAACVQAETATGSARQTKPAAIEVGQNKASSPHSVQAKTGPGESAQGGLAQDVWIDADPGCGGPFHADIDDCWALFHAWALGGHRIAGISTVFGNVSGDTAWVRTRHWLERLAADHPAKRMPPGYRGADGPLSAEQPVSAMVTPVRSDTSSAARAALGAFLDAQAARVSPLQLVEARKHIAPSNTGATLLMLGPVTNLAHVLSEKPARARAIARIIMLGGQPAGMTHWLPVNGRLRMRDYNVIKDPQAMQLLLESGISIDFVPVQAAFGHWLTAEQLAPLLAGHAALQWLNDSGAAWERFWRWGFGTPGYPPFDLLASALLFQPERLACDAVAARMAVFPGVVGEQSGLQLSPLPAAGPAGVSGTSNTSKMGESSGRLAKSAAPVTGVAAQTHQYRQCRLVTGSALDLIQSAIESVRPGNR